MRSGLYVSSLTPTTNVASQSPRSRDDHLAGAGLDVGPAAFLRVKMPVDSITTSTPSSPHGSRAGSRSAQHLDVVAVDRICFRAGAHLPRVAAMDAVVAQQMCHRLDRSEVVHRHEVDIGPWALAARKKLRPMRPKPLMPTRTVIETVSFRCPRWARSRSCLAQFSPSDWLSHVPMGDSRLMAESSEHIAPRLRQWRPIDVGRRCNRTRSSDTTLPLADVRGK